MSLRCRALESLFEKKPKRAATAKGGALGAILHFLQEALAVDRLQAFYGPGLAGFNVIDGQMLDQIYLGRASCESERASCIP